MRKETKTMRRTSLCIFGIAIAVLVGAFAPGTAADSPSRPPAVSILGTPHPDSARAAPADTTAPALLPDRVAAYYFHPTIRCHSCRWIEATADSTVHTAFASALEDGRLEWRSINFEEPADQALAQQLQIDSSTLVIAQLVGGEIVRSMNVDQAWYMVGKPKELFDHVRGRIAEYLGEKPTKPEAK
jgi:hypothetical protein